MASGALLVVLPGGLVEEDAGGLELGLHVGEAELQRLELVQGVAEGAALGGVGEGPVEGGLGAAEGGGGDVEPAAVEALHGVGEALAFLAEQVFGRDAAVVELDLGGGLGLPAHLALLGAEAEAGGAVLDEHSRRCPSGPRRRCGP